MAHITFDFDGTLVQSNAIKRQAYFDAVPDAATHGPLAKLIDDAKLNRHQVFARLAEQAGYAVTDAEQWAGRYDAITRRAVTDCPETTGATATLRTLGQAGHRLYLVSATPSDPLTAIAHSRGLAQYFDRILGSPTPKQLHIADICAAAGIDTSAAIHVGDQLADQDAAAIAGCKFVAITALGGAFSPPTAIPLQTLPDVIAGDTVSA